MEMLPNVMAAMLGAIGSGLIALSVTTRRKEKSLEEELRQINEEKKFIRRFRYQAEKRAQLRHSDFDQKTRRKKNINSKAKQDKLDKMLTETGLNITRMQYTVASTLVGFVATLISIFNFGGGLIGVTGSVVLGGLCGFFLPVLVLIYLRNKRLKQFVLEFPNALDILVRGIRSGVTVSESIYLVSEEASEPVASEFARIVERTKVGVTLSEATQILRKRIPVQETAFFSIVISIQQKSGGNLGVVLTNFSRVMRERKKLKDKVASLTQEGKTSGYVMGGLPLAVSGLINASSPGYMDALFDTTLGNILLVGAGVWMALGIAATSFLLRFKI